MARSSATDPLEKFRFVLSFEGGTEAEATTLDRAGFFEIAMPKRSTNKITYREGIDADISSVHAGLSTMEDVTLSRGQIAAKAGQPSALYTWMSAVHNPTAGASKIGASNARPANAAALEYRKDIKIQVLDRAGNTARTYVLYNAFPVNYVPGSDMNAGDDGEKMIESVTLAYEDFKELGSGVSPEYV